MLVGADESKMEEIRAAMLSLTKGWQQDHVATIVAETLDEVISPIVFAEALELFDEHHREGRTVVIVSSSPMEVVRPLGTYLGVDEVIATRARVDEAGAYTGELEFYAYGPHKETAIREYAVAHDLVLEECYAYSDSVTDLPMLAAVGHPVAVNPDKDLAAEAAERGWEIRHFARPVRLRDRVPHPPRGPTIAVGSVVAVGGAALGAYAWWRRHGARAS
jgi:HAD superfamily hydrolase (TIGR01490 family)